MDVRPDPIIQPPIEPPPQTTRKRTRVSRFYDLNPPQTLLTLSILAVTALTIVWVRTPRKAPASLVTPIISGDSLKRPELKPNPISSNENAPLPKNSTKTLLTKHSPDPMAIDLLKRRQQAEAERLQQKLQDQLAKERAQHDEELKAVQQKIDAAAQEQAAKFKDEEEKSKQARQDLELRMREQQEAIRAQAEQLARQQQQQDNPPKVPAMAPYSGPRSGTLVWEGNVRGKELITIENGVASIGRVVSGGAPAGVPFLLQPTNSKDVGVAAAPSPRTEFRSFVLRVKGNGRVRVTVDWSVP